MSPTPSVETLNAMIAIALDGANTLAKGADIIKDTRLRTLFTTLAAERDVLVARLQEEVRGLGGVPEDRGTVVGSAHRLYTEVKLALSPDDRRALIEEIQRSEDRVREKFQDLLDRDTALPRAVRDLCEAQFEQICRSVQQINAFDIGQTGTEAADSDAARRPRSRRRSVRRQTKFQETNMPNQRNEGEGNKTAAKEYNQAAKEFARSGKVEKQAEAAAAAREGAERRELEKAEQVGKSRAKEEDPLLRRDHVKSDT